METKVQVLVAYQALDETPRFLIKIQGSSSALDRLETTDETSERPLGLLN